MRSVSDKQGPELIELGEGKSQQAAGEASRRAPRGRAARTSASTQSQARGILCTFPFSSAARQADRSSLA